MSKSQKRKPNLKKETNHFRIENAQSISRKYFHQAHSEYKRNAALNKSPLPDYDLDEAMVNRRIKASVNTVEKAYEIGKKYIPDGKYPKVPGYDVRTDWLALNAKVNPSIDAENGVSYYSTGAAIWILDRLRENEKLHEILPLMPKGEDCYSNVSIPVCWDPLHTEEVLRSMTYVITYRNNDCMKSTSSLRPIGDFDFYDKLTLERKQHQDVPSRKLFDTIISAIDKEDIDAAIKRYENLVWSSTDTYYQLRNEIIQYESSLITELEGMKNQAETKLNLLSGLPTNVPETTSIKEKRENAMKIFAEMQNGKEIIPTMRAPKLKIEDCNIFNSQVDSICSEANTKIEKKFNEYARQEDVMQHLIHCFIEKPTWTKETWAKEFGDSIANIAADFDIGDPYELCFAYLYLVDTGSDLPLIMYPTHKIMSAVTAALPWSGGSAAALIYDDMPTEPWVEAVKAAIDKTEDVYDPTLTTMYSTNKVDTHDFLPAPAKTSLARILYERTGCIAPRDKIDAVWPKEDDNKFKNLNKKEFNLLNYYISTLGPCFGRSHFPTDTDMDNKLKKVQNELENAQEQLKKLKVENEKLTKSIHSAEQAVKNERKKRVEEEKKHNTDKDELSRLRETIYNMAQTEENDELAPIKENITFPYETKNKLIAFGGHENWLKGIKPMLPTVRFFDDVPSEEVIRNADAVWLQVNALKHPKFYRIVTVAKQWNVPIYYFEYSSFTKCANQLAVIDRKS